VLAIMTDYRVMADGPYVVGLNEVQVGLPVPDFLLAALAHVVGARQAERLAVGGLLLAPIEARTVGLVDEVLPVVEVVPRAIAWATDLVARPPRAMTGTRHRARRALHDAFASIDGALLDEVVEQWFAPEAQATLRALAARLGKRA
jgi:enoyl-CoA hydratase/carnithine racemase